MRRRSVTLLCALAVALLVSPASVRADVFEPIALASDGVVAGVGELQQADYAHDPAISGDGRYVAFDGSFDGVTGVWRRDLATGEVEQVAGGDAQLPSISEDGRYISFTTNEGGKLPEITDGLPDPRHRTGEAPNVYVRDMSRAPSEAEAFKVASAANGSEAPLTYTAPEAEREYAGSLASGRSAISARGDKVVFVTTAVSNLVDSATVDTPALQVAVRDLQTKQTELVSVEYNPAAGRPASECEGCADRPVPNSGQGEEFYGAVYPGARQRPRFPDPYAGASISADGSTVAWLGQEIEKQAPVLPAEPYIGPSYAEPLWRRIADGPQAPTRRVTGGGDPACGCQGPFETAPVTSGSAGVFAPITVDYLPRLSGNGQTVAFLTNAREIASGEEFGSGTAGFTDDLYVVNMSEGLTRVQALRRLTEVAGGNSSETDRVAPIVDLGVSPDGSEVAFSTERTVFPLGSPADVSAPVASATAQELFDVDLADGTLTRVTHGYEGNPSEPALALTFSPSFSADGDTLAFSSTASNLVYGDGNGASDAFVVQRKRFGSSVAQQYISPAPPNPAIEPAWLLGASAHSLPNGSVLLEVSAPGAGSLVASARSAVPLHTLVAGVAHGTRARRGAAPRRRKRMTVATRTVASTALAQAPYEGGVVSLTLSLAAGYRALAAEHGGLSAELSVVFTAPRRPVLHVEIPVSFLRDERARGSRRHRGIAAAHRRAGRAGGRAAGRPHALRGGAR